jgi:predicted DNA binding CopG/RHH family protein
MGVHIQVRDVPDAVFLALKARAAGTGLPLSEFLRGLLEQAVTGPAAVAQAVGSPRAPVTD